MRLLVSVRDAGEAAAALAGGADLVDAKNPHAGALGAVALETLEGIVRAVGGTRPVTAAIGDADDELTVERDTAAFTRAGAALVKIGFAGVAGRTRLDSLVAAAVRGAGRDRVVAVAYADYASTSAPAPDEVMAAAVRAQLAGILMDTADKNGPGLTSLVPMPDITAWVNAARHAGLLCALAGKLTAEDLRVVTQAGADIAGVRGAACDRGRLGEVAAERVRTLRRQCRPPVAPAPMAPAPQAPRSA